MSTIYVDTKVEVEVDLIDDINWKYMHDEDIEDVLSEIKRYHSKVIAKVFSGNDCSIPPDIKMFNDMLTERKVELFEQLWSNLFDCEKEMIMKKLNLKM